MSALINARDASVCASAFAVRSAPPPARRGTVLSSLMAALECARILQTLIAGVLDGDEADNQERAKIGNATPDFDPLILGRNDGSHVVSEALKSLS